MSYQNLWNAAKVFLRRNIISKNDQHGEKSKQPNFISQMN
jgi:hypothetical protein